MFEQKSEGLYSEYELLTGLAGIGMYLIAGNDQKAKNWDDCFFLS
jgi:hypothetical protein